MQATGGTYGVAKDEQHMSELIMAHGPPPPSRSTESGASLVGDFEFKFNFKAPEHSTPSRLCRNVLQGSG